MTFSPARRIAERLGITEGQAYTLAIGLTIALVTAMIGIPPTLRDDLAERVQRLPEQLAEGGGRPDAPAAPPATGIASAPAPAAPGFATSTPGSAFDTGSGGGFSEPAGPGYADGGRLGDVEMLATVAGPGAPAGVAVDPETGAFFVATDDDGAQGASAVLRFSPGGRPERTYAIEGQPEGRTRGISAVLLGGAGHLYALDASSARVLRIDLETGAQEQTAAIPDVPSCTTPQDRCELSPRSSAPIIQAAAFGPDGALFVADAGQGIIWKVDAFGDVAPWYRGPELVSPRGEGPAGMQFDGSGALVVATSTSLVALTGAVHRIPVEADGGPGEAEELYRSQPNSTPTGLALGDSGRIYVTLAGSNQLVVLEEDGTEVTVVESDQFARPYGLAFRGSSLVLTNGFTLSENAGWSVLRVAAEDRGVPLHRPS